MRFKNKLLILFVAIQCSLMAQNKYWVFFKDKEGSELNPYAYFDTKAIERRLRNNISLVQFSDLPLNLNYVETVKKNVDSMSVKSRWFNAIVVYSNPSQIEKIKTFSFVDRIETIQTVGFFASKKEEETNLNPEFSNLRNKQINSLEGPLFEPLNINGKGVRIAVFDGGFPNVDKAEAFSHIRDKHRIISTYDFTKNKENVYYSNTHGTMVLSNIAGIYNEEKLGLAVDAEFLLAKTEIGSEPFAEEEYWLAAVEWADKNGADIINSSLGYTHQRYFREQMDGSSLVARAANMAFEKGILVVNAAGNEGDLNYWKYIGTPADASHVLSVGGIDPNTDYHISFSSYGPTSDGRMKPNVSAMAETIVISEKGLTSAFGTSFSSPLVAGFAACVLQMNPEFTVQQLFDEIQKSAHLYPYYDYAHGYGIPKASYFTSKNRSETYVTFRFEKDDHFIKVFALEQIPSKIGQKEYLYFHVSQPNGFLIDYSLIEVYQQKALEIDLSKYKKGDIIRVYYKGYVNSITI